MLFYLQQLCKCFQCGLSVLFFFFFHESGNRNTPNMQLEAAQILKTIQKMEKNIAKDTAMCFQCGHNFECGINATVSNPNGILVIDALKNIDFAHQSNCNSAILMSITCKKWIKCGADCNLSMNTNGRANKYDESVMYFESGNILLKERCKISNVHERGMIMIDASLGSIDIGTGSQIESKNLLSVNAKENVYIRKTAQLNMNLVMSSSKETNNTDFETLKFLSNLRNDITMQNNSCSIQDVIFANDDSTSNSECYG